LWFYALTQEINRTPVVHVLQSVLSRLGLGKYESTSINSRMHCNCTQFQRMVAAAVTWDSVLLCRS